MGVLFKSAGMLTTVQDEGRFFHQGKGLTPAGAMDVRSLRIGNILVGNEPNEAGFEITVIGPHMVFDSDCVIALTGADLSPSLNKEPFPMYSAIEIKKGDEISFGKRINGLRSYITVAGGLDVPVIMGSKSTLLRNRLGGFNGRAIRNGDMIAFTKSIKTLDNLKERRIPQPFFETESLALRVLLGPHNYDFDIDTIHQFFWYGAAVNESNDRMGYRLSCEPLKHISTGGNILSDATVFGSIQVPGDGKPIILMADRATSGGYTKIGSIISVDLPKLAQVTTGCKLRFIQVSIDLAQDLYIREQEYIRKLNSSINSL